MSLNILNYWYDDKVYKLYCTISLFSWKRLVLNQGIKTNIRILMQARIQRR